MGLKLLCVVAHPDDECFAFGGALSLAAESGVETHVLCFTDGQAATNRGSSSSAEDLGRMRRQEFADSCDVLGVTSHEQLSYADAQLEFADFSLAAGLLVARIRALRPEIVLTFGMDGALNTHPDHSMVSAFTNAAFHWSALQKRYPEHGPVFAPDRLYTLSTDFFMDGRPSPAPSPWSVELDVRSVLERKREAFRQHRSQAPLMEQTRDLFDKHGHSEFYTLSAVRTPAPVALAVSLFDGIADPGLPLL